MDGVGDDLAARSPDGRPSVASRATAGDLPRGIHALRRRARGDAAASDLRAGRGGVLPGAGAEPRAVGSRRRRQTSAGSGRWRRGFRCFCSSRRCRRRDTSRSASRRTTERSKACRRSPDRPFRCRGHDGTSDCRAAAAGREAADPSEDVVAALFIADSTRALFDVSSTPSAFGCRARRPLRRRRRTRRGDRLPPSVQRDGSAMGARSATSLRAVWSALRR